MEWLYGIFANLLGGLVNNAMAQESANNARTQTYQLNEQAANNADQRTRNLYNDLFGVQAQYNQIKSAGLSPSLFYKGAGISGSSTGAQGAGSGAIQPQIFGIDPMQSAQIRLANAQARNLDADTQMKKSETTGVDLQNEYQSLLNQDKNNENLLLLTTFTTTEGESTSMFEMANNAHSYEEFLDDIRKAAKLGNLELVEQFTQTERGQNILRNIYMNSEKYDTYIEQLASDKVSAEFQKQLLTTLKNSEFAKLNKDAAIQYLQTNISSAELTEKQKNAWNRLLDKLGKKGDDVRDIVIVLSMIANQMASSWHMPQINYNRTNVEKTTTFNRNTNNYGDW